MDAARPGGVPADRGAGLATGRMAGPEADRGAGLATGRMAGLEADRGAGLAAGWHRAAPGPAALAHPRRRAGLWLVWALPLLLALHGFALALLEPALGVPGPQAMLPSLQGLDGLAAALWGDGAGAARPAPGLLAAPLSGPLSGPLSARWRHAAGALLGGVGLALLLAAAWALWRAGTPLRPRARPRRLVDDGPYALLRHPMAVGLLLLAGGVLLASPWPPALLLALLPLAALLRHQLRREERQLQRAFGGWWRDYAASVPRGL